MMRDLVIHRIIELLLCNGGGNPKNEMHLDDPRWARVVELHVDWSGGDISDACLQKHLPLLQLTEEDLQQHSDERLVQLFEYTCFAAYRCR